MARPTKHSFTLLSLLLLILILQTTTANENHYCGKDWVTAAKTCATPCPSASDDECPTGEVCHGYTGCAAKVNAIETPPPTVKPTKRETVAPTVRPTTVAPTVKPSTGSPSISQEEAVAPTASPNNGGAADSATSDNEGNTNTSSNIDNGSDNNDNTEEATQSTSTTSIPAKPTTTAPTAQPAGAAPSSSPIVRPNIIQMDANSRGWGVLPDNDDNNNNNNGGGNNIIGGNGGVETAAAILTSSTTILSLQSQRSYGIIFDVETTPHSPPIEIYTLEFYTPLRGVEVQYEVWTKEGTWHGFEGKERVFELVGRGKVVTWGTPPQPNQDGEDGNDNSSGGSNGNEGSNEDVESSERGEPTRIPPTSLSPIRINGSSSRHCIYLSLSSKSLLYARSSSPHSSTSTTTTAITSIEQVTAPTQDEIVLERSDELIVYEGAAVMAYPFDKATQRLYYRMPRGFVGRIWYHRAPCKKVKVLNSNGDGGVNETAGMRMPTKWEECVEVKEREGLPNVEELAPFFEIDSSLIDYNNGGNNNNKQNGINGAMNGAPPNFYNGTIPTSTPTLSTLPTIQTMKVNLILTLQNIAKHRILSQVEQSELGRILMGFYETQELLEVNEVELFRVDVWHQKVLLVKEEEEMERQRVLQLDDNGEIYFPNSIEEEGGDAEGNDGGAYFPGSEESATADDGGNADLFARPGGTGSGSGSNNNNPGDDGSNEQEEGASEKEEDSSAVVGGGMANGFVGGESSSGASAFSNGGQADDGDNTSEVYFPNSNPDGSGSNPESSSDNTTTSNNEVIPESSSGAPTQDEPMDQVMLNSEEDAIFSEQGPQPPPESPPESITAAATEEESDTSPSLKSLEITLIISILYSPLPQQITSELLQTLLVNNANSFVELLKYSDSQDLASYFRTLDSIPQVLGVERVTLPPTLRPTDSPTPYVTEEVVENDEGLGGATVAAVIFGLIYVALAICSMCYVKRARRRMKMERERKFVSGEQQPQSGVGHGMVYEEEVKKKVGKRHEYDDENGELKKKSRKGRNKLGRSLLRGGLKGSLTKKKNKVNDSNGVAADKANGQYEQQRYNDANYNNNHNGGEEDRGLLLLDEENEGSYYSEEEEEEEEKREDISSMEDSYYSSGESEYSSEESYSEEE